MTGVQVCLKMCLHFKLGLIHAYLWAGDKDSLIKTGNFSIN